MATLRQAIVEGISIQEYLESEGYEVLQRGHKLTVKGHDSLVITPEKRVFTWNSHGTSGSVIDLYMDIHGCDAKTAMTELRKILPDKDRNIDRTAPRPEPRPLQQKEAIQRKELSLPREDKSKWKRLYAYLMSTRKITPNVVRWLAKEKIIYPDESGNIVYTGRDNSGKVVYLAQKGTITPKDGSKGFRHVDPAADCDRRCVMNQGKAITKVIVTEAAVDAWSFASMLDIHGLDFRQYTYLSLECTTPNPLEVFLKENPQIKTVYLAQDSDEAGIKSRTLTRKLLENKGLSGGLRVIDKLPDATCPGAKDWNDALKAVRQEQSAEVVQTVAPVMAP